MIQRVNFVGGGKYALTYRNMAIGLGLWVALGGLLQIGFLLQTSYVHGKVSTLKERIRVLQSRQTEQLQLLAVTKTQEQTGTAIKNLASVFTYAPQWSQLLIQLGSARTAGLALQQVTGTPTKEHDGVVDVQLSGTATTMDAVNAFVTSLDAIPLFHKVELAESSRDIEAAGLRFAIKTQVRFEGS